MPNNKDAQDQGETQSAPYEGLLSQVVAKIKDEPFLFVIAIVALIIGAVVLGAGLGSSMLQFVVSIIALLAIIVVAGYYIRVGQKMASQERKSVEAKVTPQPSSSSSRQQEIRAEEGGHVKDALQEGSGVGSQVISAKGPGSSIEGVIQSSTGDSPKSPK